MGNIMAQCHLSTGNNTFRLKNESGFSRLNLGNYAATVSVGTSNLDQSGVILGATSLTLKSNFSTALTCDFIGRVGIGTPTPSAEVEVNGWYGRTAHNNGGLVGSYNNVGANSNRSHVIVAKRLLVILK